MTRPLAEQKMRAELLVQGLKPCSHCEEVKSVDEFGPRPKNSDGLECWCKACRNGYQSQWRQDNPERTKERNQAYNRTPQRKAYAKKYRKEHKEHLEEYRQRYYLANREHYLAQDQEYYQKNRDRVLARQKVYRQVCKQQRTEYNRKWRRQNPDKVKAYRDHYRAKNREKVLASYRKCALQRRAKMEGVEGSHTHEQWLELLSFFNGICPRCRKKKELTKDHIEPLDWGGSNYLANIQPLCHSCNSRKNNVYAADYRPAYVRAWAHFQSYLMLAEAA